MAKAYLTPSPQWGKHLRDWKRVFWKTERKAGRREAEVGPDFDDVVYELREVQLPHAKRAKPYAARISYNSKRVSGVVTYSWVKRFAKKRHRDECVRNVNARAARGAFPGFTAEVLDE